MLFGYVDIGGVSAGWGLASPGWDSGLLYGLFWGDDVLGFWLLLFVCVVVRVGVEFVVVDNCMVEFGWGAWGARACR